jgi:hypothetical protein
VLSLRRWRHYDRWAIWTGGEPEPLSAISRSMPGAPGSLEIMLRYASCGWFSAILQFQDGCGRHADGREALLPRGGIG